MKRLMLVCVIILSLLCTAFAFAENESSRLDIAFGLFSVALPEGVTAGPNTGNALSDFRFETDGMPSIIAAHYAPLDQYEATASRRLDSYISYIFAMSGENYSETEVQEETLENGVRLRWQIMRGDDLHALWFEAFDEQFGYNICMWNSAKTADDEAMLAVMRSFRADPERERDLLEVRQTQLPGGAFVSVEHGLRIQLNEDWEIVPYKEYLRPGTVFMLVLNEGEQMVQLFCDYPVDDGDARALLDWFLQAKGGSSAGEPYAVTLDGLGGVEAWVAEETPGVCMYDVAFVYEGYGYYGMLMWVPQDDAEARPFMMEALRTLSVPTESSRGVDPV